VNILFECTYCGHRWEEEIWNQSRIESTKCSKCGDSKLKAKDAAVAKIDGYKGCPPFPEKKEKDDGYNYFRSRK
jgi:transcription elongation factor Elf1